MACREKIRERRAVKLDGWDAYIHAIGGQLEFNGNALDRVQVGKRRLRDFLERLESEANHSEALAKGARTNLFRASKSLRNELTSPRPNGAEDYTRQKQAMVAAMAATEKQFNLIAVSPRHNGHSRLDKAIEHAMRAIVALEAELEVFEWLHRETPRDSPHLSARVGEDFYERLRSLSAAVTSARKLTDGRAKLVEAEIASGIGWLRDLLAAR